MKLDNLMMLVEHLVDAWAALVRSAVVQQNRLPVADVTEQNAKTERKPT